MLLLVRSSHSTASRVSRPCLRFAGSCDAEHSIRRTISRQYCKRAPWKRIASRRLFNLIKTVKGLFTVSWLNELSHKVTDAGESASNSATVNASFCLLALSGGLFVVGAWLLLGVQMEHDDGRRAWGQEWQKDGKTLRSHLRLIPAGSLLVPHSHTAWGGGPGSLRKDIAGNSGLKEKQEPCYLSDGIWQFSKKLLA